MPIAESLRTLLAQYAEGLAVDVAMLAHEIAAASYPGQTAHEQHEGAILTARGHIVHDPDYATLAARLLRDRLVTDTLTGLGVALDDGPASADVYRTAFPRAIARGVACERLDPRMGAFDWPRIVAAIAPERDALLPYAGLTTLYDRYLLHDGGFRFELPQYFWMRVAMGIALAETPSLRTDRAITFYDAISTLAYVPSSPTLFNAGARIPQLSSCFLTTVPDDLSGIFESYRDNALLSKFAGGLGCDWTAVRGTNAHIAGTNGESQGIVPFVKIVNDTALATNQGGKRAGAACVYLETWHRDIEAFLELRKNTGDDRRRAHDIDTAHWVPDLFMERVLAEGEWTLFSPDEVPDLHERYGTDFTRAYEAYERRAAAGEMRLATRVSAVGLWRKMLTALFETGHPWLVFKDPANLRNPQAHAGVIHSSNLCCMTSDQRVVTDRGLITVGDLYREGGANRVLGSDGWKGASAMLLPRPDAPIVQIETAEGYTHKVTPDHKVMTANRGQVEAQSLVLGDKIMLQQQPGEWGDENAIDEAMIAGMLGGDGTFLSGGMGVRLDLWEGKTDQFVPDIEAAAQRLIGKYGPEINYRRLGATGRVSSITPDECPTFGAPVDQADGGPRKRSLHSSALAAVMRRLGVTKETKLAVPAFLWAANRESVAAYLAAVYACDGTVQGGEVTTMVLASTNEEWLRDIQLLWINFGVKASLTQMRTAGTHALPDGKGGMANYPCNAMYRLMITSIQGCQIAESITRLGFHRQNHQFLFNLTKGGYQQKLWATFTGLAPLPNENAYCLTVDADDHLWTVNGMLTRNTEITLNTRASRPGTDDGEIAVCNLGSINLAAHLVTDNGETRLDTARLAQSVQVAMRMLDDVIDATYYPVPEARNANQRHRPVGLGLMGFQDALTALGISYASDAAVMWANETAERISFAALSASADLARERGAYASFAGSQWSQGLLPIDTVRLADAGRAQPTEMDTAMHAHTPEEWDALRQQIVRDGLRNSQVMAIAPTATISLIAGCSQSIEPQYKNLYVRATQSGEFTEINRWLVADLKRLGMWDRQMADDLVYYDGDLSAIAGIPDEMRERYRTAFQIEPAWLIRAAAARQKWLDMAQSLNLYLANPSGKKLSAMYIAAWRAGLKSTYYLRTQAATAVEKSAVDINRYGVQPRWMHATSASASIAIPRVATAVN